MIDQIITGMATTIAGLYPDCTIYTEPVEQGLVMPAFYIHCIDVDQKEQLSKRFKHSLPFEVVYFPLNGLVDINSTLPELLVNLALIELQSGAKIRGKDLKAQPIDGEGHLFVTYDIVVKIPELTPDLMEEIIITGGITNGD
ncbi:MAG: hypothetical protein HY818_17320 [Acetobacterium woodii]|nr:hypothetical protein [Acetobacterium woodii]